MTSDMHVCAPVVVLDLDGAAVDTLPDLVRAMNAALRDHGLRPVNDYDFRPFAGHGARVMLETALRVSGQEVDALLLEALRASFLAQYGANIAEGSRPFPGLLDAMTQLSSHGVRFAVCTNKSAAHANQLLHALEMHRHFDAIVGRDPFATAKPNAEPLLGAVARAGGTPSRAVMVGDTQVDILAARAAAVPVVAVDFGYSPQAVARFQPDVLISHFDELVGAVEAVAMQHAWGVPRAFSSPSGAGARGF